MTVVDVIYKTKYNRKYMIQLQDDLIQDNNMSFSVEIDGDSV